MQTNQFFVKRLKKLYPPYLIALLSATLILFIENNFSLKWLLNHLYETRWQYLFLHALVPNVPYDLRSMWYISVFVFLLFVMYFLLSYNDKLAMGLLPITALIIILHLYATYATLCCQNVYEGYVSGGVLRGFAEMGIGIFMYGNVTYCQKNNIKFATSTSRLIATIIKWLSLVTLLILMPLFPFDGGGFDKFALILIYTRLCYCNCYTLNVRFINKIIQWLGSINYWIYCIHLVVAHVFAVTLQFLPYGIALILYIVSVTVLSSLLYIGERKITSRTRSINSH